MDQSLDSQSDPRRTVVFSTIAKALPLILGVTAVFAAGGILLSDYQDVEYTAETRVVLSTTRPFDPLGGNSVSQAGRYVANQIEFMGSQPVLQQAATALADGTEPQDLRSSLDLASADGADVIVITTTAPTGEAAAARGNAIAYAYAGAVRALVQQSAAAVTAAAPLDQVRALDIARQAAAYDDGVQSVESPVAPTSPTAPAPLRNGFLLGALGLLLTLALVVWRRGQPLADRGALVESAGAPVLGVVPVPLRRLLSRKAPPLPAVHDYSMALVALGYVVADTSGVVMISGIGRASGAPTVALGLAAAAAGQQRRVVVVDADTQDFAMVRRSGHAAPAHSIGAVDGPSPATAATTTELQALRSSGGGSVHLATVAGGEDRSWSAEGVRAGLQHLVDTFDVVVLHAGPVASDPVAYALLRETSALVAVVDERARTADLIALREKLDLAGARADGLVLTHPVPTRQRRRPARVASPPREEVEEPDRAAAPPVEAVTTGGSQRQTVGASTATRG